MISSDSSLTNQKRKFTFNIKTFGCKANAFDSLVIENELVQAGGEMVSESPEFTIVNSCTVTNGADKQGIAELRKTKTSNADTTIVFTGCQAELSKDQEIQNTDIVIGNKEKHKVAEYILKKKGIDFLKQENPIFDETIYWGQLPAFHGKTRAFIKIQEGCNDFCTYCIIPYSRGKSRSVPQHLILDEINRLHQLEVQEFILTGINIADYGLDIGSTLEDLIENILEKTKANRIRISSLDPTEISDRTLGVMKNNSRIMPHFHVSLQNVNSRILRLMKRKYRQEEVIECLEKIRTTNSNIYVGMDYITGFPSETLEEHEESLSLLKQLPWTRLHVFPYSERKGTPALKIPGIVAMDERKRRAKELMNASLLRHRSQSEKYIGKQITNILLEKQITQDEKEYFLGHADNYHRVLVEINTKSGKLQRNQIINAQIDSVLAKPFEDWTLIGKAIL